MSSSPTGPHGLLLIDKPAGITSHDVVARVRRALGTRKVGHAGTLDPAATGLLLVGVGDATRLLTYLIGDDKEYEATIRLGIATDTEDADGEITEVAGREDIVAITPAEVQGVVPQFIGEIDQVPSAVSAIKIDGKPAYQRVREGERVELTSRRVTIHELEVRRVTHGEAEGQAIVDVDVRVSCSSGTYIRALGRDLGLALGVPAHVCLLRRASVGSFHVADAAALATERPAPDNEAGTDEARRLAAALLSPTELLVRRFPQLRCDADRARALRNGQRIPAPAAVIAPQTAADQPLSTLTIADLPAGTPVAALTDAGEPIGLVEIRAGRTKTLMNFPQRDGGGA